MTRRTMLIAALVTAVVVVPFTLGGALFVRPAVAQSEDAVPNRRHITVVGYGDVEGRPDTATVQVSVETEATTA